MALHICTIVARNYLAHARVLARSFTEHQPGGRCHVLVIDDVDHTVRAEDEPFDLVPVEALELPEWDEMRAAYDVLEFSTAVKPWLLRHMLREHDEGDGIAYFDPDIRVVSRMTELEEALAEHHLVLTPHLTDAMPRDGLKPSETDILIAGVFNLGFIGLSASADAEALLDWWSERLLKDCRVAPHKGLFVDQRWVDFVPGLVEDFRVLRHPGYNVAYWNLPTRALTDAGGVLEVNGEPLRFFHFSGFDPDKPDELSKHQNRVVVAAVPPLRELCSAYADALRANGYDDVRAIPYAHNTLPSGLRLAPTLRRMYREGVEDGELPDSIFTTAGEADFRAWLDEDSVEKPGISRYVHELWFAREDVRLAYPDPGGADRDGFIGWCWVFGVPDGQALEELLPPMPGHAGAPPADPDPAAQADAARVPLAEREVTRPFGVNVAGYLRAELGVGEVGRQMLTALDAVSVLALPVTAIAANSRQGSEFAGTGHEGNPFAVNLVCVNADGLPAFAEEVGPDFFAGRYTIGVWWWELSDFPSGFEGAFGLLDELWVGSQFVAEALAPSAPIPIVRMPVPLDPPGSVPLEPGELGWPDGFTFLFSFDYNSVFERKNPLATVAAYTQAFGPDDGARLVLKSINHERDPRNHARLLDAVRGRPDIVLIDRYVSAGDRDRITASCDCYVSLHRSEGFGLTLAEAMAMGKPAIATGYSGNLEFMTEDNSHLVRSTPVAVGPDAPPYPPEATWADPDVGHAAELMRRVFDDRPAAAELGRRAARDIAERHSPFAAGQVMDGRLQRVKARIAASAGPGADASDPDALRRTRALVARGAGTPEHSGRVARLARRTALRAMRPYTAYQHEVNDTAGRALDHLERSLEAARLDAAVEQAALLAELRRQRRLTERLASEGTVSQLAHLLAAADARIDDLADQVDELRRDAHVTARVIEGFDVGRDAPLSVLESSEDWPEGPVVPWTEEYAERHRDVVARALGDAPLLMSLRLLRPLPARYGIGFDERVVEFPWLATRELAGHVLDAGSTLNHPHVLARLRPRVEALDIVTLTPEHQAFPQLDVSYQYADLRDLPFRDDLYDTVVCISTLEHVGMDNAQYGDTGSRSGTPEDDLRRAVQELRRVLRPGGRMFVTVPFGASADLGWQRIFDADALEALLAEFAPVERQVEIFRYLPTGWERSDMDEAAGAVYRDHFADPEPAEDRAPAARAVACLDLRY